MFKEGDGGGGMESKSVAVKMGWRLKIIIFYKMMKRCFVGNGNGNASLSHLVWVALAGWVMT